MGYDAPWQVLAFEPKGTVCNNPKYTVALPFFGGVDVEGTKSFTENS